MKITKTTRFFFVYTLYFIIALCVYVFFYLHINDKRNNITETLSSIATHKQENSQMEGLKQVVADTEVGRLKLVDYFVVDIESIDPFLEAVESLGKEVGIEVDVKSLSYTEIESDIAKELNLSIVFEGDWGKIHHFLVLLESFPRKITIDRLNLKENKITIGETKTSIWSGSVDFRTLQLEK